MIRPAIAAGIWISMPDWRDSGLILAVRPHGETHAIASLLTRERGRHAGLVHGGMGRAAKGLLQPGNLVQADWRARLEGQLGRWQLDLEKSPSALVLDDPLRLAAIGSACALLEACLAEREPQENLYQSSAALLDIIALSDDASYDSDRRPWLEWYVLWELELLAAAGFAIHNEVCTLTGETEGLAYISPRTGRAVHHQAAGAYADRLLPLPALFRGWKKLNNEQEAALSLTGHFLGRHIFSTVNQDLPQARLRLAYLVASRYKDTR